MEIDETMLKARIEEFQRQQEDLIAKYGFMVMSVDGCEEDQALPFAYTIGRGDSGEPELFVSGCVLSIFHELINEVAAAAKENPEILQRDGDFRSTIFINQRTREHVTFRLRVVDKEPAALALGADQRSNGEATYVLIIWSDADGGFPQGGVKCADQYYIEHTTPDVVH